MTHLNSTSQAAGLRSRNRGKALIFGGVALTLLGGCSEWDSYMDPSVVGRWEHTPTRVPILDRIATIEDPDVQLVETSEITTDDLLPEAEVYRVGSGDILNLTVFDLITDGVPEQLPRVVDQNGYVEVPQVGRVWVSGLTEQEVAEAVAAQIEAQGLLADPTVSVVVQQRRQSSFSVMGAVARPGPYFIPAADYRLLEALLAAGGVNESLKEVYVIRQVPLTSEAAGSAPETGARPTRSPNSGENQGEPAPDLLEIIDDLSEPAPVVISADDTMTGSSLLPALPGSAQPEREPVIDLIDPSGVRDMTPEPQSSVSGTDGVATRWIFVNGQWVLAQTQDSTAPVTHSGQPSAESEFLRKAANLMTQRVIRIPVKPLVLGDARYNIIVRPGDIIRVPAPPQGNVYIDGEVVRPGPYGLPPLGDLTLMRAITAAGGLNGLAIPERVDLTRMVGNDEQATIMLNMRAIAEGTQPDIYLKPNDRINVGTNFWATPLAVVRAGLRATYGFGFLLDRNFGNDVFGAPPSNIR